MSPLDASISAPKSNQWSSFFQQSHNRFVSYWLNYLQDNAINYDLLDADEENIQSAWISAAKQKREADLLQAQEPLYQFYRIKGRISEGQEAFASALSQLAFSKEDICGLPLSAQKLYGRLLAHQAWFSRGLAQYALAKSLMEHAWTLLQKTDDKQYLAFLLALKGNITLFEHGNTYDSQELLCESYELYQELNHQVGLAGILSDIGASYNWANEYETAKEFINRAISICQEYDFIPRDIYARCLNNLGLAFEGLEQYKEANASYQRCFHVCQQLQNNLGMAFSLANQSQIALRLSRFSEAKNLSQQQLLLSQENGDLHLFVGGLADLGNAHYMLGEFELAWKCLQEGLEVAVTIGSKPDIVQVIAQFARLFFHLNEYNASLILLTIIQPYPFPHRHLGNPTNLYELLVAESPTNEVEIIQEEWQGKELDDAVTFIRELQLDLCSNND